MAFPGPHVIFARSSDRFAPLAKKSAMQPYKTPPCLIDDEPGYVHSVPPDPRRQDPVDNPRAKEQGCIAITQEKKYYQIYDDKHSGVFIKRNLTPSEYVYGYFSGELVPAERSFERMKNEAAAIRFIQTHTTIPTPTIRCAFEDRGRYYLVTDIVPGVTMDQLPEEKKTTVLKELEGHITQMRSIKSKVMGSFLHDLLPYRFLYSIPSEEIIKFREAETPEFVLCHNDLSQHNIIVDEETLKINAIIDWEYAGFFPPEFDSPFYRRPGPSAAINEEVDDLPELLEVIKKWRVQ